MQEDNYNRSKGICVSLLYCFWEEKMQPPKKVLCIMDMAGVGRSSMAVILPVLAACGVQACPLPTALFSTHLGGFGQVAQQDVVMQAKRALEHYKDQNIVFDAIYNGFLQGSEQFELVEKAVKQYPNAIFVCDPAMADHGKLYSSIMPEMVVRMKKLVDMADITTPNITELDFLLESESSQKGINDLALQEKIKELNKNKVKDVVITSVPAGEVGLEMVGYSKNQNSFFTIPIKMVQQNYPGSGDLFASALLGLCLQGVEFQVAVALAGEFVESSIQATFVNKGDAKQGIWFEMQLYRLMGYINNWKSKNSK